MARVCGERKKNFVGQQSLSRRSGGGDQLSPTSPDVAGADMDMPSWADWWFADIVLKSEAASERREQHQIKQDILLLCREELPSHKVPAIINFVPTLAVAETGKLIRRR